MTHHQTTPLANDQFDWGYIDWLIDQRAGTDIDLSLARMSVKAGKTAQNHRHPNCSEVISLLQGALSVELDGKPNAMSAGDTLFVPAGAAHKIICTSETDASVMLCYAAGERIYEPCE